MYIMYILIAMPENFKAGTNQPHGFGAASRTPIPPLARFAHRLVETLTAFIDRLRIAGSWPARLRRFSL
jgi:hypothetical protein